MRSDIQSPVYHMTVERTVGPIQARHSKGTLFWER